MYLCSTKQAVSVVLSTTSVYITTTRISLTRFPSHQFTSHRRASTYHTLINSTFGLLSLGRRPIGHSAICLFSSGGTQVTCQKLKPNSLDEDASHRSSIVMNRSSSSAYQIPTHVSKSSESSVKRGIIIFRF